MKSSIKVYNLNTSKDISTIRNIIINEEGIVACEINKAKKEIQIVYDKLTVSLEHIINLIEISGYMVDELQETNNIYLKKL